MGILSVGLWVKSDRRIFRWVFYYEDDWLLFEEGFDVDDDYVDVVAACVPGVVAGVLPLAYPEAEEVNAAAFVDRRDEEEEDDDRSFAF